MAVACTKQEEVFLTQDRSVPIRINEVFANGEGKDDEEQEKGRGDWLELYNVGGTIVIGPGEWFLTDDRDDPLKYELPTITFGGQEHLRIWCDDGEGAGIHAPFRLSSKGEWLALVRMNKGRPAIVDSLHFAPQTRERMSASRYPDGDDRWVKASAPTPGAANLVTAPVAEPPAEYVGSTGR